LKIRIVAALVVVVALISGSAYAADQPPATTEKQLNEVMKGWYLQAEGGFMYALKSDIPNLGAGGILSIFAGYDIKDIVAVELGLVGAFSPAYNNGTTNPSSGLVSSSLTMGIVEANVKVSYLTMQRWFFYARVGVGASFNTPTSVNVMNGAVPGKLELPLVTPAISIAPGFEYYTNIRHFSIGLDIKAMMLPLLGGGPGSYFLTAQPYLKYTF
jgi:hypothetical protein